MPKQKKQQIKNQQTMLYYNFNGLDGFKARFGLVEHGNGEKSRKNKILLAYIKQPSLFKQASETGDYSLINISSMSELKQVMLERIQQSGCDDENLQHKVQLINYTFYSSKYETDEFNGVCQDGDVKCVRYKNCNNGRTYKMKAAKMLQALILETEFGQTLPEQVLVYLMEEFATDFQSYSSSTLIEHKLRTIAQETSAPAWLTGIITISTKTPLTLRQPIWRTRTAMWWQDASFTTRFTMKTARYGDLRNDSIPAALMPS